LLILSARAFPPFRPSATAAGSFPSSSGDGTLSSIWPVAIHLMQMIGWLMIALFVWLFHGPWLTFKRAVDAEDWPSAGATLNRIRQIIAVNLPLGLLVVVIGGSGRYWG
jgi:uncharacterized membrane protein